MPVLIYRIEYEGGGTVPPSPHPVRHPSCTPQRPQSCVTRVGPELSPPLGSVLVITLTPGVEIVTQYHAITRVGSILTLTLSLSEGLSLILTLTLSPTLVIPEHEPQPYSPCPQTLTSHNPRPYRHHLRQYTYK